MKWFMLLVVVIFIHAVQAANDNHPACCWNCINISQQDSSTDGQLNREVGIIRLILFVICAMAYIMWNFYLEDEKWKKLK